MIVDYMTILLELIKGLFAMIGSMYHEKRKTAVD